jgi:hypothetical protein
MISLSEPRSQKLLCRITAAKSRRSSKTMGFTAGLLLCRPARSTSPAQLSGLLIRLNVLPYCCLRAAPFDPSFPPKTEKGENSARSV